MSESQIGLPYAKGSDTSREAAERMAGKPEKVRRDHQRILDVLIAKPLTDKEMQRILGMDGSTQRPRRIELVRMSMVADTGKRREGSTLWWLTKMMWGAS